jgi:hypothetical protein
MAAGQSKVVRAYIAAGLSFASLLSGPIGSLLGGRPTWWPASVLRGAALGAHGVALFVTAQLLIVGITVLRAAQISEDLAIMAAGAAIFGTASSRSLNAAALHHHLAEKEKAPNSIGIRGHGTYCSS